MSFLAPLLLWGLPLAALPVVIHLINQRRFQTIDWGAMRFLLEANRMSRGYARIRQWLILLCRALAIALLLMGMSRPLSSGWLGLAGGDQADTTIILLDRSASMQQAGPAGGPSKLQTGLSQLESTLAALQPPRLVLIDSVSLKPQELDSPEKLRELTTAGHASATADLPAMLQTAYDYIKANRAGQAEVWICSDLRASDWNAGNGRWQTLRDGFNELQQRVRFHLLAYPEPPRDNLSIRVTDVRRTVVGDEATLLVSLAIRRSHGEGSLKLPIHIEVDGARSELPVELDGAELTIKDHAIPLERKQQQGWGRVSLPADSNAADNEFYFAFADPPLRRTIVVAEKGADTRPLELAAAILPDPAYVSDVQVVGPDQLAGIAWEETSLVIWQAALPTGANAEALRNLAEQGGQILFIAPQNRGDGQFCGVRWTDWTEPADAVQVDTWRSDHDLLARTQSGAALPIGELMIRRYCGIEGEFTALATLRGGYALLARAPTKRGGVYFLAMNAATKDSSLATGGVALYVMVQRALAEGAERLATAQHLDAGEAASASGEAITWQHIAGRPQTLSTEYAYQQGVYSAGARTLAVNRSEREDSPETLADDQVASLFGGLPFDRVDDSAGSATSLTREVWRLFLVSMIGVMVVEAGLCLPKPPRPAGALA